MHSLYNLISSTDQLNRSQTVDSMLHRLVCCLYTRYD